MLSKDGLVLNGFHFIIYVHLISVHLKVIYTDYLKCRLNCLFHFFMLKSANSVKDLTTPDRLINGLIKPLPYLCVQYASGSQ